MIIERMEVTHWRGLPSAALDFSPGVTIVGGPNESGKTTLRSALRAALLLPTGSRGENRILEANRPWQTKLCPKVKLVFQFGGKRCIVEKEFLKKKGEWATLDYDGRLVAKDEEVQSKLLEILGQSAEWIDVLWGEQGQLANEHPAPDSLKGRLAAAAQDTVMPEVAKLEMLINEEYAEYWTEKKGQPTRKLLNLRDAATIARDQVAEVHKKIAAADLRTEEVEVNRRAVELLKEKYNLKQAQFEKGNATLAEWVSYGKYKAEYDLANQNFVNAQKWLKDRFDEVNNIKRLWPETAAWKQAVETFKAQTVIAPSRKEIDKLSAQKNYLELFLADKRYAELEAIEAPNSVELKKLREIETNLRDIDARLKTGELRAKIIAEKQLQVSLSKDGAVSEQISIGIMESKSWSAERGFELQIPGVAILSIESGNPATAADMLAKDAMQQELAKALKQWHAENLDDLTERATRKVAAQNQLKRIDPKEIAAARARVADVEEIDALSSSELEHILEALPEKLRVAEASWNAEQAAYQQAISEMQKLNEKNPEAQLNAFMNGLKAHWQSKPFSADEGELVIPSELSLEWIESLEKLFPAWENKLKEQEDAVAAMKQKMIRPEGEEISTEKLQALQDEMKNDKLVIDEKSRLISEAVGSIAAQGDLHASLVSAMEDEARATEEVARVELEAYAVRKLHDTFEEVRSKMQKDVVAPLTSKITGYFSTITSGFYDKVVFDAALKVGHLTTPNVDPVSLEDVSFGTREQLFLLTRLGLAELLSQDNMRQVIILDDNLVHTDDIRMAHARQMLEQASSSVQVIIFTCHPERYRGIAGSTEAQIK